MPCRHRRCNLRRPLIKSISPSGSRHSVAVQLSNVPSVSTSCCPPTPSSTKSCTTSYEDFCTSETCSDSETCIDTLPGFSPVNVNSKEKECKPYQLDSKLEREKESKRKHAGIKIDDVENATSPRGSVEIESNSQELVTKYTYPREEKTNNDAQSTKSLNNKCQTRTLKDISLEDDPNQCGCSSGANTEKVIEDNINKKLSPVSFENKSSCHTLKTVIGEPLPSSKSSVFPEKHPNLKDVKIKPGVSCSVCSSGSCSKKDLTRGKCQCKYPPALSHLGCTGKIVGNCECDQNF